jgi:hypothetical protein
MLIPLLAILWLFVALLCLALCIAAKHTDATISLDDALDLPVGAMDAPRARTSAP